MTDHADHPLALLSLGQRLCREGPCSTETLHIGEDLSCWAFSELAELLEEDGAQRPKVQLRSAAQGALGPEPNLKAVADAGILGECKKELSGLAA